MEIIKSQPCENCVECVITEYNLTAIRAKQVRPGVFEILGCELQNYGEKDRYVGKRGRI